MIQNQKWPKSKKKWEQNLQNSFIKTPQNKILKQYLYFIYIWYYVICGKKYNKTTKISPYFLLMLYL